MMGSVVDDAGKRVIWLQGVVVRSRFITGTKHAPQADGNCEGWIDRHLFGDAQSLGGYLLSENSLFSDGTPTSRRDSGVHFAV